MEDQSTEGHILIALGETEVELLVDLADLQPGREDKLMVGELLRHMVRAVVLVFDLSGDLLHDILEGDQSAGASELIDDNGQRALLLHELLHQARGEHGLWDERDFTKK